ncbi:DNA ligase [Shewanella sp. 10N.286.54.B9]|uniref:DNA ligase n=1 Tax=Shewanella sp. 10N.286.54.B9 TaxID=3229719 RepID=UPI00354D649B
MTKVNKLSSNREHLQFLNWQFLLFISFVSISVALNASEISKPSLQLATEYQADSSIQIEDYLVSEKLDGVRGYWNGSIMLSRSGRRINLPQWFTKGFPAYPIDGELWIGRNKFEQVSAIVRKHNATKAQWQQVRFMVFDLPAETTHFATRYQKALAELSDISTHIEVIPQFSVKDKLTLDRRLTDIIENNGEGLMLHRKTALYQIGRTDDIVKLKPFYDAEATVLAHKEGKGKYVGMMGALLVETKQGKQFSIGSGFSDEERRNPPKVGAIITFKYYGETQKGTPRFASFLRVRDPI